MRLPIFLSTLAAAAGLSAAALAGTPGSTGAPDSALRAAKDIREEAPLIGYTLSAFGSSALTLGVAGYAGVLGGGAAADSTQLGGGTRIWGSPIDRVTLFIEIDRPPYREVAPSATVAVRILGDREKGYAVGGMLSYRTEGFARIEGEVEGALLASVARRGFHADANVVVGGGLEEEEIDGELKLRVGYDVTPWLRAGADGRFRYRLAGDRSLPGGRMGDAIGGPQLVFGVWHFFGALGGGPTTVGVATGLGWHVTATLGGVLF